MSRRIYPLNSLRAFEASARHLSYVKAADELSVTPAALSHQVKKLEEYLGLPLFRRQQRGLVLTDSGQSFATNLHDVFLNLDGAMEEVVNNDSRGTVTLTVAPAFAVLWLYPRLHKFNALHPDIDVQISTGLELADFQRDDFDAAIRLCIDEPVGLEAIKLFEETVTPMCSPMEKNSLKSPSDLSKHVLLHNHSMDYDANAPTWRRWLDAAGAEEVDAVHGTHFGLPDHGLQACMEGQGVVLGWRAISRQLVAAGRVVEPFDLILPLGSSFYLVYPEAHKNRSNIAAIRDWLVKEVQEDMQGSAV